MLEHLCVLSHRGVVLWEHSPTAKQLRRDPINQLIRSVILEDRAGETEYTCDDYKLRWSLANEAQFIVIAVYQRFLQLLCIDALLSDIKKKFIAKFGGTNLSPTAIYDFEEEFQSAFSKFLTKEKAAEGQVSVGPGGKTSAPADRDADEDDDSPAKTSSPNSKGPSAAQQMAQGNTNLVKTMSGKAIGRRGAKQPVEKVASPTVNPKKPGKKPTVWGKDGKVNTSGVQEPESESDEEPTQEQKLAQAASFRKTYVRTNADGSEVKVDEKKWENVERGKVATWFRSRFNLGTARELDEQDFKNVLPQLRDKMIGKNVAVEIAEKVCSSIEESLAGKKLGSFDSLPKAIESAMVAALRRILEPRTEINILRSVAAAKERRKPYSIVFCGVNGVGKSTSLAKVTYWLQQNGHSIMLAACDTFRTGAVEQLQVHGNCLGVDVFEMGYAPDASAVAKEALQQAARAGTDVVLIDTAGRMQDHESRMRALAKLIHDNVPDLVLFVGEAVVGNAGIDQLRKFNQCLVDFTPIGRQPRGIDGLLLTKFDTIDDKVGAAVSMVYELGQPIVFVGVGQTYQDLKTISADVVVDMLMQ